MFNQTFKTLDRTSFLVYSDNKYKHRLKHSKATINLKGLENDIIVGKILKYIFT